MLRKMVCLQSSLLLIVCAFSTIESAIDPCIEYKSIVVYVYKTSQVTYNTSCGLLGTQRCSRYRVQTHSSLEYRHQIDCCNGYGVSNCIPICSIPCSTNKECSLPDTCTCIEGWTGANCLSDIDECSLGTHSCDLDCNNTVGSYSCFCQDSNNFVLANDGLRCLGHVEDLTLIPGTKSISLSWLPPFNFSRDGILHKYDVTCHGKNADDMATEKSVPFPSTASIFSSLTPLTNYICCVTPQWSTNGAGPQKCIEATTLREDAPEGPPINISIIAADSASLLIQWLPPTVPNGLIKQYILYINFTNDTDIITTSVDSGSTLYLLDGLNVYQLVGVSISATTGVGEGPMSLYTFNRSGDTEPDQVHYLKIEITSNVSANITWHPPISLRGIVTNYHVILRNLTKEFSDTFMSVWILGSSDFNHHIQGLYPYIPYEVDVAAATKIGMGDIVTKSFYTEQSVPAIAPSWSFIVRSLATQIQVEWEKLSLEDSRGYIIGYSVTYFPSVLGCSVTGNGASIFTTQQSLVIDELDPQKEYCVSLAAFTVKGSGTISNKTLIPVYESQSILIFIDGILDCPSWKQHNTQHKINDLSNEIITAIYESCQCPITTDYIYNSHFLPCVDEVAVIQLSIIELTNYRSETLVEILKRWANTLPEVILDGVSVQIVEACQQLKCSAPTLSSTIEGVMFTVSPTNSDNKNNFMIILWILIGLCFISFTCIAGIALCISILALKVKKRKKSEPSERNSGHPLNNTFSTDVVGKDRIRYSDLPMVKDNDNAKGIRTFENLAYESMYDTNYQHMQ